MKVTVIGTGYVGLVQAAVLAEVGHEVCCLDIDEDKIKNLNKGIVTIYEPGLRQLVTRNLESGQLMFTTDASLAVNFGDVLFIAVGTPADEDGTADMSHVLAVADTIARMMTGSKIVVNKSTVPVGTADQVTEVISLALLKRSSKIDFEVISNPEFLKEGAAISDCMRPDRIVIGTESESAKGVMRELYAPFNRNHDRIIFMDTRSAELTKYAANCMLATKISFMNEMSNIAERVGADIEQVRKGIGADERIGYHFIYPGCGYGGSCFPKDVRALIAGAKDVGYESEVMKAVEIVNHKQKHKLFEFINQHFHGELRDRKFALWGLAFKPKTSDMREAPSRTLMESLWKAGAIVQAYDPEAMEECQRIYGDHPGLRLMGTKEAAMKGADGLVVCTEWQNFKIPDYLRFKQELASAVVFDGRNLYDGHVMAQHGIKYYSIGRPSR